MRKIERDEDSESAYALNWWQGDLEDGEHFASLVPFKSSTTVSGLLPEWELDLPQEVKFTADLSVVEGLDYPENDDGWPIFSVRALRALEEIGSFRHRKVPISMKEGKKQLKSNFYGVQLLERAVTLDQKRSRFERDPDDAKEILHISKWRLNVPPGGLPPLFRVVEKPGYLFVSARAKQRLDEIGARGFEYWDLDHIP